MLKVLSCRTLPTADHTSHYPTEKTKRIICYLHAKYRPSVLYTSCSVCEWLDCVRVFYTDALRGTALLPTIDLYCLVCHRGLPFKNIIFMCIPLTVHGMAVRAYTGTLLASENQLSSL